MKKIPFNQHIAELAELLKSLEIRHVILCPGSRNAPLIQVFHRDPAFTCHSIVDERSAGYVALGMSLETGKPVAVATTSGTAVLNLGPAMAEARNQGIPLLFLTGDRPAEFPPQFTNQKTPQKEIFRNHTVVSAEWAPQPQHQEELEEEMNHLRSMLIRGLFSEKGPVHLNLMLYEPLYEVLPAAKLTHVAPTADEILKAETPFKESETGQLKEFLYGGKKILIIAGMGIESQSLNTALQKLEQHFQVAVLTENLGNLGDIGAICNPDLAILAADPDQRSSLAPDMVLAMGGPVVSKQVRLFVQGQEGIPVIVANPAAHELAQTLSELADINKPAVKPGENRYLEAWLIAEEKGIKRGSRAASNIEFSNLAVTGKILDAVPGGTTVHLGNSATVRYSQLLPVRKDLFYRSNRGTSGIDGSLSTAVGAAMASSSLHVAILGDLSFVYDSNALWNRNFPRNLRIIILNDAGGGIFRLLDGPDRMPFFEEFSVAAHPVSLESLVKSFGMNIFTATNDNILSEGLKIIFSPGTETQVLEVNTSGRENSAIFKRFIRSIQTD